MRVIAPGKLFLVGEYAVLDGGPCVVAAVDRGVACRISPGDAVETPTGDDRFVRAALAAAGAPPRRYRFTDWNPVALPDKPGFGGSAAAAAAAAAAGLLASGRPGGAPWEAVEPLAVAAHRAVQGSGSGLDVRASCRGGLRRYWPDGQAILDAPLPEIPLLAVYSGRSASTGARVARYRAWRGPDRDAFARESRAVVQSFAGDPLAAMAQAYALLCAMARAAGLDYDTPALATIAGLATAHGGAAKPSGAGGGDIAVASIPDPDARAAFAAACAAAGLPPIPVRVVGGVRAAAETEEESA